MAGPALAGLVLFIGVPFALAVVLSFTNLRLGSPLPTRFAGIENYQRLLTDAGFRRALLNNGMFAAVVVPVQTALALGLALLLNQRLRGMGVYRTLFFMPVVFPMSLVAVVWTLVYAPGPNGLMNALVEAASLGHIAPKDYLDHPYLALPAIMLLSVWQGVGFQMVILLAGLQSVPGVLYESAAIDGAGKVRRFFHITVPGIRNPLILTALLTTVLSFRVYDQVQIMTQGGPRNATTTVMYEAVTAVWKRGNVGLACAMTVVFFGIVLAVTWVQQRIVPQEGAVE
jgi:multiple sugar transport system permease protein